MSYGIIVGSIRCHAVKTDGTLVQHRDFSSFAALSQRFANNDKSNNDRFCYKYPGMNRASGVQESIIFPIQTMRVKLMIGPLLQPFKEQHRKQILNNTVSQAMRLSIPNLTISEVQLLGSFQPGTDVNVIATIRNNSDVRTQEGIFFGVTAGLTYIQPDQIIIVPGQPNQILIADLPTVETAAQLEDFEMVILPKIKNPNDILDNNSEAGFAYIDANDEVTVNFPPLRIPIEQMELWVYPWMEADLM